MLSWTMENKRVGDSLSGSSTIALAFTLPSIIYSFTSIQSGAGASRKFITNNK